MTDDGRSRGEAPRVLVVDDDPLVLSALRRTLEHAGYQVSTYEDPRTFFAEANLDPPCCVLLDVHMPGMNGIEVLARLGRRELPPPVIFMSGGADVRTSVRAMKAGAVDFLPKPFQRSDLLAALDSATARARELLDAWNATREARALLARLTPRERQVCELVAKGLRSKEIAEALGAAVKTVNVHRSRIREKVGAESAVDLARIVELATRGR